MSTIGANVASRPSALASSAATRAACFTTDMSQLDARPRLIGNTVR